MNTQSKHTPGPWHAALGLKLISDVYAVGVNGQRVFIAECATQRDALLIAAAPAMYDALRELTNAFALVVKMTPYGVSMDVSKVHDNARAALAQAEGRG